jgi:hypothetical protein
MIWGMSIKGKKQYKIYLTEENAEFVKAYLESKRGAGGLSAVLDEYIKNMAETLKRSGVKPGQKLTWAKVARMAIEGLMQKVE